MKKLIIIGGRGNGTVILSTVHDYNKKAFYWDKWEVLGFLNDFETEPINGYPILGKIDKETADKYQDCYFYYALISVKMNHTFLHKLLDLKIPLERMATIIHPTAVISDTAKIGFGVSIQPFVSVNANAVIHNYVQVFAQALIGHDSILNDYSYIANNACVGANVVLKKGAYLGTNSTTLENITIGEWAVVGIGSVVIRDVPDFAKVAGNPVKIIE